MDAQWLARLSKKGVVGDVSSTIILVAKSQIYNNFRGFAQFEPTEVAQTGNCRFYRNSSVAYEGIALLFDSDLHEICEVRWSPAMTNCHIVVRRLIFEAWIVDAHGYQCGRK